MVGNKLISIFFLFIFLVGCNNSPLVDAFKKGEGFRYKADEESLRKAIKEYEKTFLYAMEALEGKVEAEKALGILLSYDKKFIEAIKVLEKAKLVKDNDEELLYHLGFSYLNLAMSLSELEERLEKSKLAEAAFKQSLALDENNDALYYGLGVVKGMINNDIENGLSYLREAYRINPDNINTLFALGNLYYQQENRDKALKYFQEIINKFPDKATQIEIARENIKKINQR